MEVKLLALEPTSLYQQQESWSPFLFVAESIQSL
jgi:hypothetical protein